MFYSNDPNNGFQTMVISMKFDIAALTLAFMAFIASAQNVDINVYSTSDCTDSPDSIMVVTDQNRCLGECIYTGGIVPFTAMMFTDKDTKCYGWTSSSTCSGSEQVIVYPNNCTAMASQNVIAWDCFKGNC
jgi:hypothetical protein